MCGCLSDLCLIIISVLFPPLPVWIRRGICTMDSLINILLCVLGYIPGLIHSWYIIAKYPPYTVEKHSKVYYIYQNDLERGLATPPQSVNSEQHHHHHHHNTYINQQPSGTSNPTYGATNDTANPPPYTEVDKSSGIN
ncbi:protein Sna4p [[Candida] jaroonii]|uniref:Protein Sna4p n=1 Tax=[Candida] jaroonii TaxID=467808 RepID=A0ACA9Y9L2_9ASCO|nr:protein Sna4p [[Candida] jaroonii]